jgi:zinc protease
VAKRVKRTSFLRDIILLAVFLSLSVLAYKAIHKFNYNNILENSVLKGRTFTTEVVEITSPKGIKAYLLTDTTNPIIGISFLFKEAGYAYEDQRSKGVGIATSSILKDGSANYDSQNFKELLEENAISLSFDAGLDVFEGELTYLKDKQDIAVELLQKSLTSPHLRAKDIYRIAEEMAIALKTQQERPESVLKLAFNEEVYGSHPYSFNPYGSMDSIKNISAHNIRKFIKNNLTQDKLVVGIAGDITKEEAGIVIDKIFGNLPQTGAVQDIPVASVSFDGREKHITKDIPQNISMFISKGVCRNDKDFYPLFIANHILGGSQMQSRLFLLTRENEGLTYGAGSYLSINDKSCTIKGRFASSAENMPKMQEIIRSQWAKMKDKGVTAEEFESAKNYLISSYNLRFTSIDQIASILAQMQYHDLGIDFLKKRNLLVQNVQIEDVNHAASVYFSDKDLIFMNIGR